MAFNAIFDRFVESSPACVMYRATMEHIFSPEKLDAVFRQSAVVQYERELLFSTLVDVVGLVVCRISSSVHAAYVRKRDNVSVSVRALYDKLAKIETGTSRALVQHTAAQVSDLINRTKGRRQPLLKGYRTRILDGNHLSRTDRRLNVLKDTSAASLPGQALALLDPERMLIDDVIPCEDAHAQERSLLDQVLLTIEKDDLLIDDRNFCTLKFLFGIKERKAYFITRQHSGMPWKPLNKPRSVGHCETGRVFESLVELRHPESGKTLQVRRITVKLSQATRDGDREIHLVANLPAKKVRAVLVASLYRKRWTLEQAFNELTTYLRCELNTLGYPKAALFAFCVAVSTYNLLAAIKGALRGVHGDETVQAKVSNFFLTEEISGVYGGMMIALPPSDWKTFQLITPAMMARKLHEWARKADIANYPKHPRTPKTTPARRRTNNGQHVSTARLLADATVKRKSKRKPKSASP